MLDPCIVLWRKQDNWKLEISSHLNICPDISGFMYLLKESGFVEGRKHSQAFVQPHNKWWAAKGGKLGLELCPPRQNKMVSASAAPPLKSNAGFNEHTLSTLGAKRKPWDTICLCLSALAACIFFLPHSKGSYLELLFVTPLQTQG